MEKDEEEKLEDDDDDEEDEDDDEEWELGEELGEDECANEDRKTEDMIG